MFTHIILITGTLAFNHKHKHFVTSQVIFLKQLVDDLPNLA